MKNFIQKGETLTTVAPSDILSGAGLLIGSVFGVCGGDALTGEDLDLTIEGVFELPKVSALAIAFGDTLYWDATAKLVTKTASSNKKIGVAASTVANPSPSVATRSIPNV